MRSNKTAIRFILFMVVAAALIAQQQVVVVNGPATQLVLGYSGSNIIYTCESLSFEATGKRAATFLSISAVSKANPAVVTSTAHGFNASSRPKVTISGATGTGWTAINATWTATIIDADTFSIAVNSTGFGTLAGTVIFNTTAPRTSVAEWRVSKLVYDGSSNLIWTGFLNASPGYNSKCSEASSAAIQQQ